MSELRPPARVAGRALLAATLLAVALPAGASAHVPGIGNGLQLSTDGPDLRSATTTAATPSEVRFCFDTVVTAGNAASYRVRSYDTTRYWIGRSITGAIDASCVVVQFDNDVTQGTIGEIVAADAARSSNKYGTAPASEPLGGSVVTAAEGRTTGPDLTGARISGSRLRYTFDEPIAPVANPTDPSLLSLLRIEDQSANTVVRPVSAQRADTSGRNVLEATFADESKLNAAVLAIASRGAVVDLAGSVGGATPNPDAEILIDDRSLNTAAGGLVPTSASVSSSQTVEISYNNRNFEINQGGAPSGSAPVRVSVYSETGEELQAQTVKANGAYNRLQADFGEKFAQNPSAWVLITVSPYQVKSVGTIGAGRSLPLSRANSVPGYTSGPDLLSATINNDYDVTYRFDEEIAAPAAFDRSALTPQLLHVMPKVGFSAGEHRALGDIAPFRINADKTLLQARHPSSANQSVGAGVRGWDSGATNVVPTDLLGYPAPSGSVSYEVERAPSGPAPAPAPTPAPAPAPIAAPAPAIGGSVALTRKLLKKAKKTRKKKAQPYAVKYSGRIASPVAGCVAKRRIYIETRRKNGKVKYLGTVTTNNRGAFGLALKNRPKGKVYLSVFARPGDNCGVITGGGINA